MTNFSQSAKQPLASRLFGGAAGAGRTKKAPLPPVPDERPRARTPPPLRRQPSAKNLFRRRPRDPPPVADDEPPPSPPHEAPARQLDSWSSLDDLFWDHMREVQNKWNTLKMNDDIWAKLIYFEQNKRLAKAYVSAPVLTIDGSTNGLDGFRIGLSGIDNDYRSLDSAACLRSIGLGIKLKIDSQGNILMRKIGPKSMSSAAPAASGATSPNSPAFDRCSVWVKNWPATNGAGSPPSSTGSSSSGLSAASSSAGSASSLDKRAAGGAAGGQLADWSVQEIAASDVSYKIFDMARFRRQLESSSRDGPPPDWRQCVSIISFVRNKLEPPGAPSAARLRQQKDQRRTLRDPCWLMLINIIAIDVLKSSLSARRLRQVSPLGGPAAAGNPFGRRGAPSPAPKCNSASEYLSPFQLHEAPPSRRRPTGANGRDVTVSRAAVSGAGQQRQPAPIRRSSVLMMASRLNEHHQPQRLRPSSSVASIYSAPRAQPWASNGRSQHRLPAAAAASSSGRSFRPTGSQYRQYRSTQFLGGEGDDDDDERDPEAENEDADGGDLIYTTFTGQNRSNNYYRHKVVDRTGGSRLAEPYLASKLPYLSASDYYETSERPLSRRAHDATSPMDHYYSHGQYSRPSRDSHWNAERHFPGRIPYVRQLDESRSKSRSMSNFDWSLGGYKSGPSGAAQRRPVDLGSFKSTSFKINFDDTDSEQTDVDGGAGSQTATETSPSKLHEVRHTVELEEEEVEEEEGAEHEGETKATASADLSGTAKPDANQQQQEQQAQKAPGSSVGSAASSSSGCPENDYFISNSSTSMSSSSNGLQKSGGGGEPNGKQPQGALTAGLAAAGDQKANIKSTISRSRHSNIKRIETLEDEICVHCEQLSDCGYSNDEPCDCCCDCDLYYSAELGRPAPAN